MIELVTQAYMLMAPVGLAIVCLCIGELTRERQERAGRALYAGFKRWLTDGGGIRGKPLPPGVRLESLRFPIGGYSGATIVDPAKVRPPNSSSGVVRIGGYQPTKTQIERVPPSPDRVPPRGGSGTPKMKPGEGLHG